MYSKQSFSNCEQFELCNTLEWLTLGVHINQYNLAMSKNCSNAAT